MHKLVHVVAHVHPFAASERIERDVFPGSPISELVAELVPAGIGRTMAILNGERVGETAWASTIPAGGDHLVIRVIPAGDGPGGDVKFVGDWVFLLGLALLATPLSFLSPLLFVAGSITAVAGTALLVGEIIHEAKKSALGGAESLPGIRGGRNQAKPWGKVPLILGKHLITPLYAARPYTAISGTDGEDMYLHQLFCVGYGPLKLSQFKIGETLVATNAAATRNGAVSVDGSYEGVDLQVYQDGTAPSLYPEIVLEDQPNLELSSTNDPDKSWRATALATTKVSLDITLPRGLYQYNDDGDKQNHSVTIVVKRRVFGSGTAWADATTVQTWSLTKAISHTIRYTFSESLTAGQYEYAIQRTTTDDADDFTGSSLVQWTALRSIRESVAPVDATTRARHVYVALKIKASKQLQGVVDQLNCIAEAEVEAYDGTGSGAAEWALAFSRNPAAAFLRVLQGPCNPRPVADARIDWTRLEAWYTTCATKGWTCDAVVSSGSRGRDLLQKIAQTGRASLTLRDGLYSVAVDEAKSSTIQHFTPRNSRNFSWTKAFRDQPHGLRVNFVSADDGYATNERIVLSDGYRYDTDGDGVLRDWLGVDRTSDGDYTTASKFEQIDLWGVTSAEVALKHARYHLAVGILRPEAFSFETDAEAIVCEPGDLVRVAHDAIAVSQRSGRVKSVTVDESGNALSCVVDENIIFEAGKSYAVRFRRSDGVGVYVALSNAGGTEGTGLTFTTPIAAASVPAVGDIFTVGEAGIETMPCIVAGVEMLDELSCRVFVVDEAAGVHTADTGTIPAFVSRVSRQPVLGVTLSVPTIATTTIDRVVAETAEAPIVERSVSAQVLAPGYLGPFSYASLPASADPGDTALGYSAAAGERGIYLWTSGAWEKQTTPTSDMIMRALADICRATLTEAAGGFTGGPYGAAADYLGSGVNVFDVLAVQTEFVNKLFAQYIKLLTGGSIRGGDRYDETGATVDSTKPGFFIAASGACKVAGIEFEGSQGGGVQWGSPHLAGNSLSISTVGTSALTALNGTDVAFIDSINDQLRVYRFDGTNWVQVGNSLSISTVDSPALTALNGTDVAFIDGNNDQLRVYRFDGTNWVQVGNSLSISTVGFPALTALNGTDVAFIDGINGQLKVYRFDGTNWVQVGNSLSISVNGIPTLTALNGTDVAFIDGNNEQLRVYRFDGTNWVQVGNSLSISTVGFPALAALNGTDVAFIDSINDQLRVYRFDGTNWVQVGSAGSTGISNVAFPALAALNGTDVAFIDNNNDQLRVYRFSFATSVPYSRQLTGF